MATHSVTGRRARIARTRNELVDRSLYRIAAILLRIGLDAPSSEKLLRKAFILAAGDSAQISKRPPTQSQVASLAGVSRREVRTLSNRKSRPSIEAQERSSSTRLNDLVHAWRSDSRFTDRHGKARPLALKAGKNNFDLLVKTYGRDVTTKTLKDQLIQKRLAKEKAGKLELRSSEKAQKKGDGDADLQFLASQLQDIDFQLGRRAYLTKKISISVTDRKSAQRIRRLAIQRLEPLLNSIASISPSPIGKPYRLKKPRFRVLISTAIATEEGFHDDQGERGKNSKQEPK